MLWSIPWLSNCLKTDANHCVHACLVHLLRGIAFPVPRLNSTTAVLIAVVPGPPFTPPPIHRLGQHTVMLTLTLVAQLRKEEGKEERKKEKKEGKKERKKERKEKKRKQEGMKSALCAYHRVFSEEICHRFFRIACHTQPTPSVPSFNVQGEPGAGGECLETQLVSFLNWQWSTSQTSS